MSELFTSISTIDLNNEFVANLNEQLINIDGNFKKMLAIPLLKGDKGDSIKVIEVYPLETNNDNITILGKKIIQEIYKNYPPNEYTNIINCNTLSELQIVLQDIETDNILTQSTSINFSNSILNTPVKMYINYKKNCEDIDNLTGEGVSAGYIFHFDGRLHQLKNFSNIKQANFIDTSCALMINNIFGDIITTQIIEPNNNIIYNYHLENYDCIIKRLSIIPTLYFDGSTNLDNINNINNINLNDTASNTFCWMINDVKTGITAQGITGDKGESIISYICQGDLLDNKIQINSVISPTQVLLEDLSEGSIVFVWFQHTDNNNLINLDLTVGILQFDDNNYYIDYNIYDSNNSIYCSFADVFRSLSLYNEMYNINKYINSPTGIFIPDKQTVYNNNNQLQNNNTYHLASSLDNSVLYIGLCKSTALLKNTHPTQNLHDSRTKENIYNNVTQTGVSGGIFESLYAINKFQNFSINNKNLSALDNNAQAEVILGKYNIADIYNNKNPYIYTYVNNSKLISDTSEKKQANIKINYGNLSFIAGAHQPIGFENYIHIKNPYTKINFDTYNNGFGSNNTQTEKFDIYGYDVNLINTTKINIGGAPYYDGSSNEIWRNKTTGEIYPRIDITGNKNYSSLNGSNYISLNNMKLFINVSGMSEYNGNTNVYKIDNNNKLDAISHNSSALRVVEIYRKENEIIDSTSGANNNTADLILDINNNLNNNILPSQNQVPIYNVQMVIPNITLGENGNLSPATVGFQQQYPLLEPQYLGYFNSGLSHTFLINSRHYKLGFQCTNASMLISGYNDAKNSQGIFPTILKVSYGNVEFDNSLVVGNNNNKVFINDSTVIAKTLNFNKTICKAENTLITENRVRLLPKTINMVSITAEVESSILQIHLNDFEDGQFGIIKNIVAESINSIYIYEGDKILGDFVIDTQHINPFDEDGHKIINLVQDGDVVNKSFNSAIWYISKQQNNNAYNITFIKIN